MTVSAEEGQDLADIKGRRSISSNCRCRTICWRGLSTVKLHEKGYQDVNTSDADIVAAASRRYHRVVTWNRSF